MKMVSGFGTVFLFMVGAVVFAMIALLVSRWIRPKNPTEEKQSIYESGEAPVGTAWGKFNPRFYVVALIFLLFEAELVFLFPWAVVFGNSEFMEKTNGTWGRLVFVEAFIFVGILAVGLAYIWAKGMLEWVRPKPEEADFAGEIPLEVYDKFNERMKNVRYH